MRKIIGRPRGPLAPILIGGCYRSGTSLLRRMLDAHSSIHCGPEVKFFKDFHGDYLKDELAHARFFATVRTLGLDDRELVAVLGRAFVEVHERAMRKRGKRRWADKNPENVLYMDEWHELLDGRLQFVHVIRHPLDTLASMLEAKFDKAVPAGFEGKVEVYRRFVEHGLAYARRHRGRSHTVRYEELVSSPSQTLETLCRALDERFESEMLSEWSSAARQDGIEDPKVKRAGVIHTAGIGRWQSDLSRDQARLATERLRAIASDIGYALDDAADARPTTP